MKRFEIHHGDCLEVLRTLPDNSVDAIVTDPPYGLGKEPEAMAMLKDWMLNDHHEVKGSGFMGKKWDAFVPQPAQWKECLRVLKPGGYLLSFAGTRTQDLVALGLRLAGFEIRDMIAWVYGSGFPKSLDVSKAIDKMAGVERDIVGVSPNWRESKRDREKNGSLEVRGENAGLLYGPPATDAAKQWDGWGTALKPALEPITLARKPLIGTVATNVLEHGTGGLNIDGCRVSTEEDTGRQQGTMPQPMDWGNKSLSNETFVTEGNPKGRWPANLIHDGSEEVLANFPTTTSGKPCGVRKANHHWNSSEAGTDVTGFGDTGSAARFFYCAKTSKTDRNEGCEDMDDAVLTRSCQAIAEAKRGNAIEESGGAFNKARITKNNHPTVKPTDLMRYLCRLVTPPGGVVLDPFMGSGSTGKAAVLEGFRFIGIEREVESVEISKARIEWVMKAVSSNHKDSIQSTFDFP